ncbi:TadE/TadG family type IV pilus assembly protein [Geomonas anaerohicana]|uniref:Pilus assembly protein n=1 Tax=Geomonas anaerohicana TaxID=2798583 RepID=A0ABS0YH73_9BACT|nr:TadE/TadG family type IV pilus assembly protein [Geomonas anaerohicana]MBJ6751636.1 pilus assembly protein [Geomonas anaerohicana]
MSNKKGQALVEFALLLSVVALLGFAVCDLAWMFFVNLTMQHAVRAGTRYAITGRTEPGLGRRGALIEKIREQSMGLYDRNLHVPKEPRISVVDPAQVNFANYTGTPTQNDPGERNQIIVVSLTYTCPLLTPALKPFLAGGAYTFTVRSAMANENFPEKGGP